MDRGPAGAALLKPFDSEILSALPLRCAESGRRLRSAVEWVADLKLAAVLDRSAFQLAAFASQLSDLVVTRPQEETAARICEVDRALMRLFAFVLVEADAWVASSVAREEIQLLAAYDQVLSQQQPSPLRPVVALQRAALAAMLHVLHQAETIRSRTNSDVLPHLVPPRREVRASSLILLARNCAHVASVLGTKAAFSSDPDVRRPLRREAETLVAISEELHRSAAAMQVTPRTTARSKHHIDWLIRACLEAVERSRQRLEQGPFGQGCTACGSRKQVSRKCGGVPFCSDCLARSRARNIDDLYDDLGVLD